MRPRHVLFALPLALAAQVPAVRTTAADRTALSVTIYQNDLAAVRDTRRVRLPKGTSRLAFADLLPSLRPKSAVLLDPGGGLRVLERTYEFNLLSPASLVDASLGQPVRIKGEAGRPEVAGTQVSVPLRKRRLGLISLRNEGDGLPPPPPPPPGPPPSEMSEDEVPEETPDQEVPAQVEETEDPDDDAPLYSQIVVLQKRDPRILVRTSAGYESAKPSDVGWNHFPEELRATPTLWMSLGSARPEATSLQLLYTAEALSWKPHYEAVLGSGGHFLSLVAFATVSNQGGMDIENATLQLVGGKPNLVYDPPPVDPDLEDGVPGGVVGGIVGGPPVFKVEKISEYPLFTLDRPVTLKDRETKQLFLFRAEQIPMKASFLIQAPYMDYMKSSKLPLGPLFGPLPTCLPVAPDGSGSEVFERHHPLVIRRGTFKNDRASHLGRALPKGSLTLRYQDPSGALVLLPGEGDYSSDFPQTPPGEEVELTLGPARGFRVDRHGVEAHIRAADPVTDDQGKRHAQRCWEYSVEVRLAHDGPEAALVTVREPVLAGGQVLKATHPGHRSGENAWDFEVPVSAHGAAVLRYTALTPPEAVPEDSE